MSTTTDMRDAYVAAELAVLQGLSFRIGDLQFTRANLPEFIAGRKEWEARAQLETLVIATPGNSRGPLSVWGADFSDGTNYAPSDNGWWPR